MIPQWLRPFFQHAVISLWRRKPILLALVLVSAVLVLAFQYNAVGGKQPGQPDGTFVIRSDFVAANVHQQQQNQQRFAANSVDASQVSLCVCVCRS